MEGNHLHLQRSTTLLFFVGKVGPISDGTWGPADNGNITILEENGIVRMNAAGKVANRLIHFQGRDNLDL